MLDNLLNIYRKSSLSTQRNILANIEQITKAVSAEYLASSDLKNAAIDEIVAVLLSHKDACSDLKNAAIDEIVAVLLSHKDA